MSADPMSPEPPAAEDTTTAVVHEEPTGELTEETLVEDVSIDGMCGVY